MANKKYSLTKETKVVCGQTLYRIKANMSFGTVKKGEFGGCVESLNTIRESGNAWVSGNAKVSGDAKVSGNAKVSGDEKVTKLVINLIVACEFNITAYGKYIQVGCELRSVNEWKTLHKSGKMKQHFSTDAEYKQAVKAVRLAMAALDAQEAK